MSFIQRMRFAVSNNFYRAGVMMVCAAGLSLALMPRQIINDAESQLDFESIIPKQFGGWQIDSSVIPIQPDPQTTAELDKIYSQTLARTYFNVLGQRVMLSIAYGANQSKALQVHKPEVCYASLGFDIGKMTNTHVDTTNGQIPAMQLVAKKGGRNEPITYWIRIGDTLARGWFEQNWTRISYGLNGKIVDGVLVRVSTISNDEQDSYRIQQAFLGAMLQGVRKEDRVRLIGKIAL